MGNSLWFRPLFAAALGVAVCTFTAAHADSKPVTFETIDGVTLAGDFYEPAPVAPAKARDATVLLLHNIDKEKGGNSHVAGWNILAKALQDDGYSVLSFDFRGFGESTKIAYPKTFWDPNINKQNVSYVKGGNKATLPDTINHKDFDANSSAYYPYLVNDIAAAKAYLDGRSDANTSSLIVIGAGDGATLGALWMEAEWHRQKFSVNPLTGTLNLNPTTRKPDLEEPEGRDLAGAVWLNLSPKLAGREIPGVIHTWLADLAVENKVPMAFLYGKDDDAAEGVTKRDMEVIQARVKKDNPEWSDDKIKARLALTIVHEVKNTKLSGSDLLGVDETPAGIVKYLDKVMVDRGSKAPRVRDPKDNFLWTLPGTQPVLPRDFKHPDQVPVDRVLRVGG